MIAIAYEMGLTMDEFFSLSWYEWSMEIHRANKKAERENSIFEGNARIMRRFMSLTYSLLSGKGSPKYNEEDFLPLPSDTKKVEARETREMTREEIEKKFGKHLKNGK